MVVVTNTSPLNYLVRLGNVDVLKRFFETVLAPEAVLQELTHPDAPPEVRRWASEPPAWLQIVSVTQVDATLPSELGAGERAAIAVAVMQNADLVLMDDWSGRREAELRNLAVEGT